MKPHVVVIAAVLAVSGCAANTSTKYVSKGQAPLPRSVEPVCFVRAPLPSNIDYTKIGEVRGGKKSYGTVSEIIPAMADEARSIGADALINVTTGQRMGAWAWARPVGSGTAIKLANRADLDCLANGGEWH